MSLSEFADVKNQARFATSYKLRECIYKRLKKVAYKEVAKFDVEFAVTKEPVPFEKRLELEYKPISSYEKWSKSSYECGWFKLTADVPAEYEGQRLAGLANLGSEALFVDENGHALQGLSTLMAVIEYTQPARGKSFFEITKSAKPGKLEVWLEAGNNKKDTLRCQSARFNYAKLVTVRDDVVEFYYDYLFLDMLRFVLNGSKNAKKRKSIVASMRKAIKVVGKDYLPENVQKGREILTKEIESGEDFPFTLYGIGHAHLDLAWLWPIRETQRKAIRTFANQVRNIEKHKGYKFGVSQPQQLVWLKEMDPKLYDEVAEHIKKGNIEAQGAMWVESDVNVPSGESLVRQMLLGQRYWRENFGVEAKMCWLPDVFGYNGNLPQILLKAGIPYFSTQKMSWNEHNRFPHRSFNWVGIDGSTVLTHMPPDNTYNSEATPFSTMHAYNYYPEKDKVDTALLVYGIGDGGGGPGDGHIQMAKRHENVKHIPKIEMRRAEDIFGSLEKNAHALPKYQGELYLEKHQGTYTSQAKIKKYNRKIEYKLQNIEYLCSLAMGKGMKYPQEELNNIWKEVLLYQFHDIIPGSSIKRVYDECYARYEILFKELDEIKQRALDVLSEKDDELYAINPTSYRVKKVVDVDGKLYEVEIPAFSSAKLNPLEEKCEFSVNGDVIESPRYIIEFNKRGNIIRLYDKFLKSEFVESGKRLNVLNLYRDKKLHYNAWDIDINYTKILPIEAKLVSAATNIFENRVERSNLYAIGSSNINQKVILYKNSPLIDFVTTVDWKETHKMLRAEFRPNVKSDEITCDIQFGNIKRSTKNETSIEKAQFEICAHNWVDVSEDGKGLSFLTESKYGWRAKEGLISLNLLRSPMYPAKDADKGIQQFSYALYPHGGDYNDANTQKEATIYNNPLIITKGSIDIEPVITSSNEHVVIETIKKQEEGDGLIVRTFEDSGKEKTTNFKINGYSKIYEVNLDEKVIGEIEDLDSITYKPFEIKSYLLKK